MPLDRRSLRASAAMLARAFDRAPLYLAVSSISTGEIVEVNDTFVQLTGYTRDEAVGRSTIELGLWADHAERAAGLEQLMRDGAISDFETTFRMRSGEERTVLITAEVVEIGGENYILNAAVDITDRKRAEADRVASDERYRTLFNSTDEGFCIIEVLFDADATPVDYRFLEANPRFEDQSGLKNAVGRTARELVPNLERHWFEIYGEVALTGASTRFENGSEELRRWFDVYAFRIGGEQSRRVGVLFKDITGRKQAERALADLNRDLEERVAERTREVRILSGQLTLAEAKERARLAQVLHDDLQQQLYAVMFALRDVRRAAGDEMRVRSSLGEVEKLLKEALEVSRTTTANLSSPVLESESLVEALRWLASDMRDRHGLDVVLEAPVDPVISSEPVRMLLFDLVRELLFNVVKHASVTRAKIRVDLHDDGLEIVVSDYGKGFDVADMEDMGSGTGYGLAGARKRMELFGGRLEVTSVAGEGTRVQLILPADALTLS